MKLAAVWPRTRESLKGVWDILVRAITKFIETDGEQRAASFAYYAFFSIFPLLLLLVSLGTMVLGDEQKAAQAILDIVANYIPVEPPREPPLGEPLVAGPTVGALRGAEGNWFVAAVESVVRSRGRAGLVAGLLLGWAALRFFQALVRGVNKAWGTKEYSWWRLPIKNFFMVGILASALFLGVLIPFAFNLLDQLLSNMRLNFKPLEPLVLITQHVMPKFFIFGRRLIPLLVLFYGLAMFYRFAPRRKTTFREIWRSAVVVTFGLQILQFLFVFYATNVTDFNRLYGTLASVVALLIWIYLSGGLIIFGGCLSAAEYEVNMHITDQSERSTAEP